MSDDDMVSGRDFVRRRPQTPAREQEQPIQNGTNPTRLGPPLGPPPAAPPPGAAAAWPPANPVPGFEDSAPAYAPVNGQHIAAEQQDRAAAGAVADPAPVPLSRSFLEDRNQPVGVRPSGLRRLLRLGPRPEEVREYQWRQAISRRWNGPRTVAFANPKGGASKTPSAIGLSALFAREGGSAVLAWDNNVTRGSLGWRTEQSSHNRTVLDLLGVAEQLMAQEAKSGDLNPYVRHQSADRFDVLASAAHLLPNQQRITEGDFDAIWQLVTKYYHLVMVDSGNEETAPNWVRMIDRSDVLVVPMANRLDHAEAAREMLQSLRSRDEHSAHLASSAVVIVSEAIGGRAGYAAELREQFATEDRAVVVVPFDPAIGADHITYDALAPATQRAYLEAAAAVAARFDRVDVTRVDASRTASGGWQ